MSLDAQGRLDAAVSAYKAEAPRLKARELAEREEGIWKLFAQVSERPLPRREKWMPDKLGARPVDVESRSALFRSGAWVDPLWERLDSGDIKKFDRARRLRLAALAKVRLDGIDQSEALRVVLASYDKLRKAGRHLSGKRGENGAPSKSKGTGVRRSSERGPREGTPPDRRLGIRKVVEERLVPYFDAIGVPEPFRLEVADSFLRQLDVLLDDFEREAKREKARPLLTKVSEHRFRTACELLGIEARYGVAIDLHKVRVRKGKLQAPLHPDRTGGEWRDDFSRQAYESYEAAYGLLNEYNQQLFGG